MVDSSTSLVDESASQYDVKLKDGKYTLHVLTSPYTQINQMSEFFLNEVDAIISNETFARGMDIQSIEVSKEDFERKTDDGQVFESSTHSVVHAQISAITNSPTRINSETAQKLKDFFKPQIAENSGVEKTLEHMLQFNMPAAEAARIIVNMTPSLSLKVIEERALKSAYIEFMKPQNIIERSAHYITPDAVLKDIPNIIPEHKTSVMRDDLVIDGKAYIAEIFIDHSEIFVGTPDDGDISMSFEAIAVYGYANKNNDDEPAFVITANDARSMTGDIFKDNRGLEDDAMKQCVNTSPELYDIFQRYKVANPEAELSPPQYKR
tara:strand:+ start:6867 stop:7832 length:966 start_codon:yes stop_codon:yes gene_type:complete